ncbi:4530_t:CDS:2, partial [Funneliformis geosporum]
LSSQNNLSKLVISKSSFNVLRIIQQGHNGIETGRTRMRYNIPDVDIPYIDPKRFWCALLWEISSDRALVYVGGGTLFLLEMFL